MAVMFSQFAPPFLQTHPFLKLFRDLPGPAQAAAEVSEQLRSTALHDVMLNDISTEERGDIGCCCYLAA